MRLLETSTLEIEEFTHSIPPYAILSHRWRDREVTFKDFELGRHWSHPAFDKIQQYCKLAASRSFRYAWVDSCCIDKSSSAELSEAINSMFRWYEKAGECHVYLQDVKPDLIDTSDAFKNSSWFTRGWTLQELIAPANVYFFDQSWSEIGTKSEESLVPLLSEITLIPKDLLCFRESLSKYSIAQRLSWAATRHTTRIEDEAYSLLGLMEVHMPLLYGEGTHAFIRLQEEIIKQAGDESVFAWSDARKQKGALAPSVSCFSGLQGLQRLETEYMEGFSLTNAGLNIQGPLCPWTMDIYLLGLDCCIMPEDHRFSNRSGRAYIFVKRAGRSKIYVRVAVEGYDTVYVPGGLEPEMSLRSRMHSLIIRENPVGVSLAESFDGFRLDFGNYNTVNGHPIPQITDIVCFNQLAYEQSIIQTQLPDTSSMSPFRLASGAIRLKLRPQEAARVGREFVMIYFGFDFDFAPICCVTLDTPGRGTQHIPEVWKRDLTKLSLEEKAGLLDLEWLKEQVDDKTEEKHLATFHGSQSYPATMKCSIISLDLTFSWGIWDDGESNVICTVKFCASSRYDPPEASYIPSSRPTFDGMRQEETQKHGNIRKGLEKLRRTAKNVQNLKPL